MKKVGNKVVVVGLGAVGVSYAYSMLNQALCEDMVLININRTRAEGEARDFRHGMPYATSPLCFISCPNNAAVVLHQWGSRLCLRC